MSIIREEYWCKVNETPGKAEMREKIRTACRRIWYSHDDEECWDVMVDEILSLLIEEIKKVENPYHVYEGIGQDVQFSYGYLTSQKRAVFNDCRQKILKALESE